MDDDSTDNLKPDNWPANQLPEKRQDWQRFAASDREAGFEITGDFKRFSQRNDMFNRVWWDKSIALKNVREFYSGFRKMASRKGDGFKQRDFALRNAAWVVAHSISERNRSLGLAEGFNDEMQPYRPKADEKMALSSPQETTAEIKKVAKLFGADLVGIAEYDERWVYSYKCDVKSREERPIDFSWGPTHVIVLGHAMDYDLIKAMPSALAGAAIGKGYSGECATAMQLAQYVLNLGFDAVASMNDTALAIPYAIKAGLGEYGRNQMLITEEFGPRVRFSKIFTNLPLSPDKPRRFGVREFCDICSRCADACPVKAIPYGPPSDQGPNQSSIKGVKKWTADCEKCFGYWTKMKTDCSICMRECPFNKDFSKWSLRLARKLAATPLRKLLLKLDTRLGWGKRVAPKDWWGNEGGLAEQFAGEEADKEK
jgi:epoxyqueuosine reductase